MTKTYVEFICDTCGLSSFENLYGYEFRRDTIEPIAKTTEEAMPESWTLVKMNPSKGNALIRTKELCLCKSCSVVIKDKLNNVL